MSAASDLQQARKLLFDCARRVVPSLKPVTAEGQHYVRVADHAMRAPHVIGTWHADLADLPITGWQIDVVSEHAGSGGAYGMYSVDELIAIRPVWVAPLILPGGWSFYCDDDVLVDVLTPDDEVVPIGVTVARK